MMDLRANRGQEDFHVNGKIKADLLGKRYKLGHLDFGKIKDMIKVGTVTGITDLGKLWVVFSYSTR